VIVVLGCDAGPIRAGALRPATFVVNPDYARRSDQLHAVRFAGHSRRHRRRSIHPGDHPAASGETIDRLLAGPLPLLRVPRYRGRRGHPIWFSARMIPEFLSLPEAAPPVTW